MIRLRRVPMFLLDVFVIWIGGDWFDRREWDLAWHELTWEPEIIELPTARLLPDPKQR